MKILKKFGFLAIILAFGLSFQACSKNKDVSSAAEATDNIEIGDEGIVDEAEDIAEENLDDAAGSASLEQAKAILDNYSTIYFGYDESSLSSEATSKLQDIATALNTLTSANITIEGHCDERGSNEYNLALGDRRARSVYDYLTNLGVDPSQLDTISYGEERPAVAGSGESVWAQNRRAQLVRK